MLFQFELFKLLLCDALALALTAHDDVDHHDDRDDVRDRRGEIRVDELGALQLQADRVEEAEHQRSKEYLDRVRAAEDDAGKRDIAAARDHALPELPVEVAERQMRAGKPAHDAAQDRRDPLHSFGILACGAQRFGRFAGRADPEADRRAVGSYAFQFRHDPGRVCPHSRPR